jgi:hypothetical protein
MRSFGQLVLILLCMLGVPSARAEVNAVSVDEATAAITTYTEALKGGDITTLGDILGGNLLVKRAPLWDSPDYATMLTDTYAGSTFQIASITTDQNNGNAVVRLIMTEGRGRMEKELILARIGDSVRIIDERMAMD